MSPSLISILLLMLGAEAREGSVMAPARAATEGAVVLVELFTSEGCSSCPPADALVAEIAGGHEAGTRTVTLSEHVDYWDDLGWRDRFSSPVFTRRQEAYARRFGLSSVYTPQLVVSGRTQVLGGDRRAALAAIAAAAREPPGRITARIISGTAATLTVAAEATWRGGVPAEVLLALVQDRATTRVAHGENAGRILEHVSVVRSLSVVGSGVGAFSGRATFQRTDGAIGRHIVVFVQEREGGPVHAATVLELP